MWNCYAENEIFVLHFHCLFGLKSYSNSEKHAKYLNKFHILQYYDICYEIFLSDRGDLLPINDGNMTRILYASMRNFPVYIILKEEKKCLNQIPVSFSPCKYIRDRRHVRSRSRFGCTTLQWS